MITFREFLIICEKKSSTPPHAVPGTYKEVDGVKTYTLARHDAPPTPLGTEKKVKKELEKQGGIGGGAIKKAKKKAKKISKIEEQIPHMQPTEYNKQIARQSVRWKGMQIRQSHGEMEHEAGAQLAAKKARMKAILSR